MFTKYIKEDQNGFMPGRQMTNLTGRVLNGISKQKVMAGIISLGVFKVSASTELPTLKMITEALCFKESDNSDNSWAVLVNDGITEQMSLGWGTGIKISLFTDNALLTMENHLKALESKTTFKRIWRDN